MAPSSNFDLFSPTRHVFWALGFLTRSRKKENENSCLERAYHLARILLRAFVISFNPERVPLKYHYIILQMITLRLGEVVHSHKSFKKQSPD